MAEKDKRYYWLKLKRDFFKRHDIQIIEGMPNGKDYILFYLKLLCESVDHDGNLRFSEQIPYNEQMLSTITNTNIDIVRSAIKIFTDLHMMDIMDDGTYYMSEVNKMLGSETYWAQKKREQRVLDNVQPMSNQLPTCPSKSKSIELDIDKDIDLEREEDSPNPAPAPKPVKSKPVKHKYGEYKHVLLTDAEYERLTNKLGEVMRDKVIKFLDEYIQETGYSKKDHNLTIRRWVIDAVKEREGKKTPTQQPRKTTQNFEGRNYDMQAMERMMLNSQNPPKTVSDDPNLQNRAEELRRKLAQ